MKKIFTFAIMFAAVAMVACGGQTKKAAEATEAEVEATEVVATEECTEECCAEAAEATEAEVVEEATEVVAE